jgi:hypothetical protein
MHPVNPLTLRAILLQSALPSSFRKLRRMPHVLLVWVMLSFVAAQVEAGLLLDEGSSLLLDGPVGRERQWVVREPAASVVPWEKNHAALFRFDAFCVSRALFSLGFDSETTVSDFQLCADLLFCPLLVTEIKSDKSVGGPALAGDGMISLSENMLSAFFFLFPSGGRDASLSSNNPGEADAKADPKTGFQMPSSVADRWLGL